MNFRYFHALFYGALALSTSGAWADKTALPGQGFDAAHFSPLWTKSPFAVASAEPAAASPDYSLVGVVQLDGVSYVSLIDKQSKEHILIASNKPDQGLSLISVTPGKRPSDTSAVIQKGGQSISLKLEQPPEVATAGAGPAPGMGVPDTPNQPGVDPNLNMDPNVSQMPPPVRIRPRLIRVPPNPNQ